MKLLLCSVRDEAVGAFLTPFFVRSRGEAIRSFTDAINDPKSQFLGHVNDYSLWYIGTWNDEHGELEFDGKPDHIILGAEVLNRPEA